MKNASLPTVIVFCACIAIGFGAPNSFENFVRRNVPSGFTMSAFVETCEGCGVLYGNDVTYKCLADSSMKTFKGCFIAVNEKR